MTALSPKSPNFFLQSSKRRQQLAISMAVALLAHIAFITAVRFTDVTPLETPPVKLLKVKLGNSQSTTNDEELTLDKAQLPTDIKKAEQAAPAAAQAAKVTPLAQGKAPPAPSAKPQTKAKDQPRAVIKAPKKNKGQVAKKQVKKPAKKAKRLPQKRVSGDALGNQKAAAQQRAIRYTQELSLWIDKFKDYPQEVKDEGIEGVVKIYLTMDREGNIQSRQITQHSPYPILDRLAMDAVRRANPVPKLPDNYPDRSRRLAFIIALKFRLNR